MNYSEGIHFIYPEDYYTKINNSIKTSEKTSKNNYDEENEDFMLDYIGREIQYRSTNFISVIELENHDLILLFYEKTTTEIIRNTNEPFPTSTKDKLHIYRLKNEDKKYYLYQEINIDKEKKSIKKLSGNRFLSVSDEEVEIYSLNNNN